MKDKKFKRLKKGFKNKKIGRKKVLHDVKEVVEPKTITSLKNESQILDQCQIQLNYQYHKKQQIYLKKYFEQVFYENFFNSKQKQITERILEMMIKFPQISFERFINKQQVEIYKGSFKNKDISQYLKALNNQLQNKRKKIILRKNQNVLCLTQELNRQTSEHQIKGRFITELQREVYQNHQNFIEKVQFNQHKYKHCSPQLSQTTQQLLFLTKIYKDNNSKIKKHFDNITLKNLISYPQPYSQAEKIYYEVVIKKNIAYAFNQSPIDFYNYFQAKQLEQENYIKIFQKIQKQDQLKLYLKDKKSKKGKQSKYGLSTACSCCFSNNYQPINPFLVCQNCNLRCHKLCLNLKQSSCGNCSYQRIHKQQKQKVEFCFICKQSGQMIIKFNEYHYAHGFCLLLHNLWKIQSKQKLSQRQLKYKNSLQNLQNQTNLIQSHYNSIQKEYQLKFYCNTDSQKLINEKFNPQQQFNSQAIIKINQVNENRMKFNFKCKICLNQVCQDLHVKCSSCGLQYHAFCAFFEGFSFNISQNSFDSQSKINILFDCCKNSAQKENLKNKREFILNRNRFLFKNL